ncbi:hypothetical protein SeLEV6574_g04732 [Synchytrium endobioticum]|uniref:Uncharacterized protein n=1 Tax=Synchytrium endobioticum TaxID=286115 RepID=A0A507CY60_9FUNG|nr:hypothetical protein SeLEV6574_g04732 [Synchytrium endobioticum]
MLTSFIIITLLLWHHALPTIAEITDEEYSSYAKSLREYRRGITDDMKRELADKLKVLYSEWKNQNDPYGTGITDLLIEALIPEDLRIYMKLNVGEPHKDMSRNEFVWEGLTTIYDFTYFSYDDVHWGEIQRFRALTAAYEERLKAQIRIHLFGSADLSKLSTLSAEVAHTYMAQKSRPSVSSFTQVELIKMNWLNWCVDELHVDTNLARFTEMDEDTVRELKRDFVDILAFSQLAAGRIALIQSALEKFNMAHPSIPVAQLVNDMDVLNKAFAEYDRNYGFITWKHVLGTEARRFLGIINSAPPASSQVDFRKVKDIPDYVISLFHLLPPPESMPPEYLELARRFHQLVMARVAKTTDELDSHDFNLVRGDAAHLCLIYDGAVAARSSESASPIDNGRWAASLLTDARLLFRTYAKAVDAREKSYAESLREYRIGMPYKKKEQLRKEMEAFYVEWKGSTDPYHAGITSITGLLIAGFIPRNIPFTVSYVMEPMKDMSQSYIEFVWEALETLNYFKFLPVDLDERDEVERLTALGKSYEELLKVHICFAFLGSAEASKMLGIPRAQVERTYLALESPEPPRVFSFDQLKYVQQMWNWCQGKILAELKRARAKAAGLSNAELVRVLTSLEPEVGRMQLLESSLTLFLEQHRHLYESSNQRIRNWDYAVHTMKMTRKAYHDIASSYMNLWATALRTTNDVLSLLQLLRDSESLPAEQVELARELHELIIVRLSSHPSDQVHAHASLTHQIMDDRIGVNSVAARDHGSSAGHFQELSQDTSRTMTKHGRASSHRNPQRRHPSSKDMLK